MATALPTSYVCTTCDVPHSFPAYVFDHWAEPLVHTCANCEADHLIHFGEVVLLEEGVLPEAASNPCYYN